MFSGGQNVELAWSKVCALQIFTFHSQIRGGAGKHWALRMLVLSPVLGAGESA